VVARGAYKGQVVYRKCKKVKEQENGQTVEYEEGVYYDATKSQKMGLWDDGYTICYKRGNINYLDISDNRQDFADNSKKVGCKETFGYAKCGGSTSNSLNTEYSYCYKSDNTTVNATNTGYQCPIQGVDAAKPTKQKVYREGLTHEPIYGFNIGYEPACINGKAYTPNNPLLEQVFVTKPKCTALKDNWNQTLVTPDYTETGSEDSEYNIIDENGIVTPYNLYVFPINLFLGLTWVGQKAQTMKLY
jgi:hypothetical protein